MSKIKKVNGAYLATIAAAVKDGAKTQSEINAELDSVTAKQKTRLNRIERLVMGEEARIEIQMEADYGDTAVVPLVAVANDVVMGDIVWSCNVDCAVIEDSTLRFTEHYTGEVTVTAKALNASASHTFTVRCDELPTSTDYSVSNVRADAVEADAVKAVIKFTGTTTYTYPMKEQEVIVREYEQEVSIAKNTSTSNVTRKGTFVWNDVAVDWKVTQKGVKINALAGDILCSDMSIIRPVIAADGYTVNGVELGGKTPIGICVVPTSHMADGKARFISLDWMSCSTPTTGGQKEDNMYWGGYGNGTEAIDISALPNLYPPYAEYCFASKTCFNLVQYQDSSNGLYYATNSSMYRLQPPFLPDGGINQSYRDSCGLLADFDGKGNTDKIIAEVTASWKTGAITNSIELGNYPAACCCRRYKTTGTSAGNWYLPTMGELGYLVYNAQMINNVLASINKPVLFIDRSQIMLWSSNERDARISYYLWLHDGTLGRTAKNSGSLVRAFLAK